MNFCTRFCIVSVMTMLFAGSVMARDHIFSLANTPHGWDNTSFAICYYNDKSVYNLRSFEYCRPGKILDLKISPNYLSFATLYQKKGKNRIKLFSYTNGKELYTFKLKTNPVAIAYSANAKYFIIATEDYEIHIYRLSDKEKIRSFRTTILTDNIALSDNGYYIAVFNGNLLDVFNGENGRLRKEIEIGAKVQWVAFSRDNKMMAASADNGSVYLFDTKSLTLQDTYDDLGSASYCMFHPEGKYLSVITAPDKIKVINMKKPSERDEITSSYPGITKLSYCSFVDKGKPVILAYNNAKQMVLHELSDLVPDYEHLVADEVENLMDDWMKMMPGESLEDFQLRVNDETRAAQYAKFENVVATELAGDLVGDAEITFGNYSAEQKRLELNFDNLPTIYLDVEREDLSDFIDPGKLTFDNSIYGVGTNDQFELLYTEVTNSESFNKYIFDNLAKQPLNFIKSDDEFVPLELIQQSSMEEITLQEIREEVVTEAQEMNLISEHTHIGVRTKIEASNDADGKKILNYNIEFNYVVDSAFSIYEDFKPGKYNCESSASAEAMLKIVKNAFENEFRQYITAGCKVRIVVTGAADALPINRKIPYDGEYGNLEDLTITKNGELTTVNLTKQSGITTNEQLALARGLSVQNFVTQNVDELQSMDIEYDYIINVSNELGAEFRRIGIKFIFYDAFKK